MRRSTSSGIGLGWNSRTARTVRTVSNTGLAICQTPSCRLRGFRSLPSMTMRRGAARLHREREVELRTNARLTLIPDPAAVHFNDLPGHRQAESGPHDLGRRVVCAPLVAGEQLVVEVLRHADPVVFDACLLYTSDAADDLLCVD